jgi:hypothetical protein
MGDAPQNQPPDREAEVEKTRKALEALFQTQDKPCPSCGHPKTIAGLCCGHCRYGLDQWREETLKWQFMLEGGWSDEARERLELRRKGLLEPSALIRDIHEKQSEEWGGCRALVHLASLFIVLSALWLLAFFLVALIMHTVAWVELQQLLVAALIVPVAGASAFMFDSMQNAWESQNPPHIRFLPEIQRANSGLFDVAAFLSFVTAVVFLIVVIIGLVRLLLST